jgi:RNA polymerase sigma factor (sigma-70 family)
MNEREWLAERFEANRTHMRAVAYRMLGSVNEADDAVQESWLRLSRADVSDVENLRGWLTTVVARVSLDMLRSRNARREEPFGAQLPEPIVSREDGLDPEHEALIADSVGLALLVVLETLEPAERLAFVLHDMFSVPFAEIAPVPDPDLAVQRRVVDAFLAAARDGDFDALVATLDPDVVLRVDRGTPAFREVRGAAAVLEQARTFARFVGSARPALVNGAAGVVVTADGRPLTVAGFTVERGRIVEIDVLADPARLRALDLTILEN